MHQSAMASSWSPSSFIPKLISLISDLISSSLLSCIMRITWMFCISFIQRHAPLWCFRDPTASIPSPPFLNPTVWLPPPFSKLFSEYPRLCFRYRLILITGLSFPKFFYTSFSHRSLLSVLPLPGLSSSSSAAPGPSSARSSSVIFPYSIALIFHARGAAQVSSRSSPSASPYLRPY